MITLGVIFYLIARSARATNFKRALTLMRWSEACFNTAIGFIAFLILIKLPTAVSSAEVFGIVFLILVVLLVTAIVLRVKLKFSPTIASGNVGASFYEDTEEIDNRTGIDYELLADKLFDVSLELTNLAGGQLAMEGAARYSMSTINTATMYGTGLYEYSVLLLRARMKKIYTNKVEFESEDNKMIEIFANKMQIPVPAFLKIVDRSGGIRRWGQELKKETKLPMTEYMDKVRVIVNKATRDLMPSSQGNTSSSASSTEHLKKNSEDEFNDGL